jgi:enoyl-CoA hydratase/carnithine racemase
MRRFEEYKDRYESLRLERSENGVLEATLHTAGEPSWVFSNTAHHELGEAFLDIAGDRENRVVILTGTGSRFCADFDYSGFPVLNAHGSDIARWDGTRMLTSFLEIEVPVIAAINGPVASHSELPLLADIVIAADHVAFADRTHMMRNTVPGDGVNIVWPLLLGANRGRYFLLTGQEISAQQALDLGVVSELHPLELLMPRARELANQLAGQRDMVLQGARHVLIHTLRTLFREQLYNSMAVEVHAIMDTVENFNGDATQVVLREDLMPHHPPLSR